MRVTILDLRRWIAGAAFLLLAVVAGFFIYGRNRFRHIEKDLPKRLGINIQQTANTITFSQSTQGHTLFTLKAARQVQLKSGHVLLHDVAITLYGPPGSGRTDRISGDDFDYDQSNGVIVSQGDVDIELQGTQDSGQAPPPPDSTDADTNTIRVKTRGLTFLQKTGEASTQQKVEFQLQRAAGTSMGCDYNSKTGVVVLTSQVHITTSNNGKPAVVDATHATLLRASDQAFLVNATINYQTEEGASDQATVNFRKDGSAEKIDAQGHVRMKTDDGATVNAETAHILLDAKSQPTRADLGGGVQFASARSTESMHGSSGSGTLQFVTANVGGHSQAQLRHGEFRENVSFDQQVNGLQKDPRGRAEKQLRAQKVDVEFVPAGHGVEARRAIALGGPVVTSRQMPSKGPEQTTRISGDQLIALLGDANSLRQLDGTGNTSIVQSSTDGSRNTSRGDVLHTSFTQEPVEPDTKAGETQIASGTGKEKAPRMQTTLDTAIQDGHVVLTELPAKKPGATSEPATLSGWAQHAEYHASSQILHLTGNSRISDAATMQIAADQIDYHRDTQNAAADGHVKATYTQAAQSPANAQKTGPDVGGSGPVHIIADHATMDHAQNQDFFYGAGKEMARMWQDPDSLVAPVIEIDRDQSVLKAYGQNTGSVPIVNANFTSTLGGSQQPSVVRVHSQTLVYSDQTRQADFHGTVTALQGTEAVHSDEAVLYLKPAAARSGDTAAKPVEASAPAKQDAAARQNSQLDHMVATGHVLFEQPGRRGNGEKLVYTADDGRYVLTGTEAVQPQVWDRVHGTTTGEVLTFNGHDDKIGVSGGKSSAVTETRARK
jgi:lipopolysaccharide export system protein LptA